MAIYGPPNRAPASKRGARGRYIYLGEERIKAAPSGETTTPPRRGEGAAASGKTLHPPPLSPHPPRKETPLFETGTRPANTTFPEATHTHPAGEGDKDPRHTYVREHGRLRGWHGEGRRARTTTEGTTRTTGHAKTLRIQRTHARCASSALAARHALLE